MASIVFIFSVVAIIAAAIYLLGVATSIAIGFCLQGRPDVGRWQARGKYTIIIGIPLLWVFLSYLSLNPNDDFYLQRLSDVSLQAAPKSARVVAKSPSLFGLHSGESCAYSRISLSQEDYEKLFKSIETDPRFTPAFKSVSKMIDGKPVNHQTDLIPDSEMRQAVSRSAGDLPLNSSFIRPNTDHHEYGLIFLADGKHIEVHSCL